MGVIYEYKIEKYLTKIYKDYCDISDKPKNESGPFYFDDPGQIMSLLETFFDEKSFVSNYGNKFAECRHDRYRIKVETSEDKVSLKFYFYSNRRIVGQKFFNKNMFIKFVTYNYKKNEIYQGNCALRRKKKFNTINKNTWYLKPLSTLSKVIFQYFKPNNVGVSKTDIKPQTFEEVDLNTKEINKCFDLFLEHIPNIDNSIVSPDIRIYKHYLDGIGVKLPNNWHIFKPAFPQITKKVYKKHKFKFIDAYMSVNRLNGDKIKRVLHTVTTVRGIYNLRFALELFGNDFILSKDDSVIKYIIESAPMPGIEHHHYPYYMYSFSKNELLNCFEIFKLMINGLINHNTFIDHLEFRDKLSQFEPVTWKSKTYTKFNSEHFIWSEKVTKFKDPRYQRMYTPRFKEIVEEPMDNYYPILLTTFQEYSMESIVQSNCVRTYNNRPESIIISIRVGDIEGEERASVEYKIYGDEDNIELVRVQSLGRFNKQLDITWNSYLEEMDKRIKYIMDNNLFELPNYSVEYKGVKLEGKIIFDDLKEIYMTPSQSERKTNRTLRFDNTSIEIYKPSFNLIGTPNTNFIDELLF
jgi:hypothetical protein